MGHLAIMAKLAFGALRGHLALGGASLLVLGAGPGLTWGSSSFPLMLGWSLGALACLALLSLAITHPALACGDPWKAADFDVHGEVHRPPDPTPHHDAKERPEIRS